MTTHKKLIAAAKRLLDTGGDQAVTLRAVGHACGISHNAPYKHFKNRDALLAAVATVSGFSRREPCVENGH
jgi:AcrR family transcriptional regulator